MYPSRLLHPLLLSPCNNTMASQWSCDDSVLGPSWMLSMVDQLPEDSVKASLPLSLKAAV